MSDIKVIEVKQSIFADNDQDADRLREQLKDIDELRFIFTSPSFITEKADKQLRENDSNFNMIKFINHN